jgi:hypothetical protein
LGISLSIFYWAQLVFFRSSVAVETSIVFANWGIKTDAVK